MTMAQYRKIVPSLLLILATASALAVEKIQVLGLFKDKAVVVIDGKRRVLRAGGVSPEGVVLVSSDAEGAVMEVDGERKRYTLGAHISNTFARPAQGPTTRVYRTPEGMYQTGGSINGYPVDFLVDTGATLIAMNRTQARRLGIDYEAKGEPGMSSTASGEVRTYYVTLKQVKVGAIELRDVEAAVIDKDAFPADILLGNSFLNRLHMQRSSDFLELRKKY